jgi:hypothetical protein
VVDFPGSYHAIFGRPCYAKFMAVPNYTYLKLKMPGPNGIITVGTTFQQAYACDRACVELASAVVASTELAELRKETCESAPDSNEPKASTAFKSAEDTKMVSIDPADQAKTVRVATTLSPA